MPLIHNNILCVTVPELVSCGIDKNTVFCGIKRQHTGEVYCWEHHKEGKRVFIHYNGLKEIYQNLIKNTLCDGIEPAIYLKKQEAQRLENKLIDLCNSLPSCVEVKADEIKQLTERNLFDTQTIQRIARAAGWLRLWRTMDLKASRKLGFQSVKEIQAEIFKCCISEQNSGYVKFPKPINNERVLDRKAREYENKGLDCLVSGCFGNPNRRMIKGVSHALLIELASRQVKLSFEDISMYYNTEAKEREDLQMLTVSAIKSHLNQPKIKPIWYYARHGKYDGDAAYQVEITRNLPSRPDALWSIDGTTMQLYYRDENGKIKSDLYVCFVTDVYSSAIIGYSVAFSETTGAVAESLQNAIFTHEYAPDQIQYDNSSANVSTVMQALMSNLTRVHFGTKPNHGQSKYVETYIGHFQQQVLRKSPAFKGGNITTKSPNSKANPDLLKQLKNNPELLLTEFELIQQFEAAVKEWNARGERRDKYGFFVGKTKLERYQEEHEERRHLNYTKRSSLFCVELPKPYQYGKQGIEITLNGKKHKYIVPDEDKIGDFEFFRNHNYEEFTVHINSLDADFAYLYQKGVFIATAHEKERFASCIADLKDGEAGKIHRFIAKQEEYGYNRSMSELERQREELRNAGLLKATGTDGFGWWNDTPKPIFNIISNRQEDIRNGMSDDNEIDNPALRALLNM